MKKQLLFVLYDSIFNSVFPGQVLQPIKQQLDTGKADRAIIVSFERHIPSPEKIKKLINDSRITLLIRKQIPFLGTISLRYAAWQLKKMLKNISPTHITARGPLAGWIVMHATAQPFILQARGLAAEEYRYVHDLNWYHRFRAWQYEQIERHMYSAPGIKIQAVSDALRSYLIEQFHAIPENVTVSAQDIPTRLPTAEVHAWRSMMRKKLAIKPDANVYVYCGSAHSWQCPEKSISFFEKKYQNDSNSFLLILTGNQLPFAELAKRYNLLEQSYHITTVPHEQIYQYLAAADAGLLFRKSHLINWVSRPTKALEYRAVGLKIIHNNTVEMLCSIR